MHRIGLIGCGWFAPFHLKAISQLDDRVHLIWVADPKTDNASRIGKEAGARVLSDYKSGLKDVDSVIIIVPHNLHHLITIDCLKAGKNVLLEKPLANTLAEADEMIATADRAKLTLMVAYPHRYRKSMQKFKQLIEMGHYGSLITLDGLMDESLQGYALDWLSKRDTLGGGVYFSSSPHMLDVMLWIAGPVRFVSMVGTRGGIAMEGEDTAASIIKFKSGVIGITRHTWASPKSNIWYTMRAQCQKAWLTLTTTPDGDLFKQGASCLWKTQITKLDKENETVIYESDEGLDLKPEISHFLDCVETGATPQTDGRKARQLIEMILFAYRQAESSGANV